MWLAREELFRQRGYLRGSSQTLLKQVISDEHLNKFLSCQGIKWQFNLSRAPWWGGQIKRMGGVVKRRPVTEDHWKWVPDLDGVGGGDT